QLDGAGAHPGLKTLADRDRALMRRLVATILRRLGTLGHLLSRLLDRGIPTDAPRAQSALLIGAAQILWMDVPDHAAVDLSVRLVQSDRRAAKYAGLVNAVLRRCARERRPLIGEVRSQTLGGPPALVGRCAAPGDKTAQRAHAGARVSAVDRSTNRVTRVRENLARLGLEAETVTADATEWQGRESGGGFDGILVDAPCASTGTIRRHPDVA